MTESEKLLLIVWFILTDWALYKALLIVVGISILVKLLSPSGDMDF